MERARRVNSKASWLVVLIAGIVFAGIGSLFTYQADRSKDWPMTTATVTRVETEHRINADDDRETRYTATYEYTADDQTHTSTTTQSNLIREGETLEVKYNPDKPSESVTPTPAILSWIFIGLGAVMAVVGIVMFVARKKEQVQPIV